MGGFEANLASDRELAGWTDGYIRNAIWVHLPHRLGSNEPMAIKYGIKVLQCDACGHRWLPESEALPERCPIRCCRSRKWNQREEVVGVADEDMLQPAPPPATTASLGDVMARFGLTTASKMHEQPSAAILNEPVEHDEPQLPMCTYTEYDTDTGETYACGRQQHSWKVKHTRGARI